MRMEAKRFAGDEDTVSGVVCRLRRGGVIINGHRARCVLRVDVAESADDGSRKGRGQRNYGMWCRDGRKGVENDREAKALEWGPVLCERAISIAGGMKEWFRIRMGMFGRQCFRRD